MALKLLALACSACMGCVHSIRSASTSTYNLKATAALYIQSMEQTALTKIDRYGEVPGMHPKDITAFLTAFNREVLEPELYAEGFSRTVTATGATVVLGDLHGQLFNLLAFLRHLHEQLQISRFSLLPASKLFICDPKIQYIFMGDYVDRGERSVEIVLLLFAYKALCPSGIILLQGNHEEARTNEYYGFNKEVEYKLDRQNSLPGHYGHRSMYAPKSALWGQFNTLFSKLPFVAVAKGMFMATHGGISPKFVRACSNQRGDFNRCLSYDVGSEMVWSDPHEGDGWAPSPRGAGIYRFGVDVALQFLYSNGLKRLLRGHEQMAKGISTIVLDRKREYAVQTVFSAADYIGTFCVDTRTNRPLRPPAWDPQMFNGGGQSNLGGIMVVDFSSGTRVDFNPIVLTGNKARELAKEFTGAHCHHHSRTTASNRPESRSSKGGTQLHGSLGTTRRTSTTTPTATTRRTSTTATTATTRRTSTTATTATTRRTSTTATTATTRRTSTTATTATTGQTSTTATTSTTEAETEESIVPRNTKTEETEEHTDSEGTTTAIETEEHTDSEGTPTAMETEEHTDSDKTTTVEEKTHSTYMNAMESEEHADSEKITTTTTIDEPEEHFQDADIDMWDWSQPNIPDEMEEDTSEQGLPWKEKFKKFFGVSLLERVHDPETEQIELPIHCREQLSQEEAQEHEDYVRSSLMAAEDMQFEARKIIDLQGEAAVCEDPEEASSENCKAMSRDVITLKVFTGLKGSKQVLEDLEESIVGREEELEGLVASRASQEYWPAAGFSGLIDLVFLVAEPISPTPEHFRDKASVASASLEHVARGLDVAINSIDHNIQLQYPHREKAEALLVSASDILREATYLFDGGGLVLWIAC
ncbi:BSU1 [Symbiodinium sp. CCMP2592]|nr:BSU1 [Symbiodinium sp. CCMP2592]